MAVGSVGTGVADDSEVLGCAVEDFPDEAGGGVEGEGVVEGFEAFGGGGRGSGLLIVPRTVVDSVSDEGYVGGRAIRGKGDVVEIGLVVTRADGEVGGGGGNGEEVRTGGLGGGEDYAAFAVYFGSRGDGERGGKGHVCAVVDGDAGVGGEVAGGVEVSGSVDDEGGVGMGSGGGTDYRAVVSPGVGEGDTEWGGVDCPADDHQGPEGRVEGGAGGLGGGREVEGIADVDDIVGGVEGGGGPVSAPVEPCTGGALNHAGVEWRGGEVGEVGEGEGTRWEFHGTENGFCAV